MGGSRVLDGRHVLTSCLSVGDKWPKILSNVGGLEGRAGMAQWPPLDPPLLGYRSDTNNAYYYQKFYSLQSYYSLWTQKRKFSEYAACEYGYVENVKFMLWKCMLFHLCPKNLKHLKYALSVRVL